MTDRSTHQALDALFLHRPNAAEERRIWMEKHVGNFPTGIACRCISTVTDHASIAQRNVPLSEMRFGPGPDNYGRDHFTPPQLQHDYYCDSCGAMYHPSVVEKTYMPREKQK